MRTLSFRANFDTTELALQSINGIHADMLGLVGGDKLDVNIEDIAFDDDYEATIVGSVRMDQIQGKDRDLVKEYICQTIQEADDNLHKFIRRFNWIKLQD